MKIIVIDSGFGGKDFIKKAKYFVNKSQNIKYKLVIPFEKMVSSYNKFIS
jgi:hypothetical protein